MSMVSTKGLTPAAVLAALYNASKPQGMGFLQYNPTPMSEQEAAGLLEKTRYFDYLMGRVMKVSIPEAGGDLEPRLYDRDNGDGAAHRAIEALRHTGETNSAAAQLTHMLNTKDAADSVRAEIAKPKVPMRTEDGFAVFTLGLDDVAAPLGESLKKAGV